MRFNAVSMTISALFLSQFGLSSHADEIPQCLFRKVVAFGASVTQATPTIIPGYKAIVSGIETYGKYFGDQTLPKVDVSQPYRIRPYGDSPARIFVGQRGPKGASSRITYMGSYFTQNQAGLGSSQIQTMLYGKSRALFESASLIVGVDAFYWDSIWGNCGPNGVEPIIRDLIEQASQRGTILMLGTVPHEVGANVRIDSNRVGIDGLWYAPQPECTDSINQTLNDYCTPDRGCYIVDLKGTVDDLNCGYKLPVNTGKYGLYELRPDGVHLSDFGSQYIADLMTKALKQNPPTCSN